MEDTTEVIQNVEEVKMEDTIIQKLEEIKLEVDENPETSPKVDDQMKQSSLSKFFKFRTKSFDNLAGELNSKVPKSKTLMRMFSKKNKEKDAEKEEDGPDETAPRRTNFIMRGLVNCQMVPWISRHSSQINIHKPLEVAETVDDDATPQEVATSSEVF